MSNPWAENQRSDGEFREAATPLRERRRDLEAAFRSSIAGLPHAMDSIPVRENVISGSGPVRGGSASNSPAAKSSGISVARRTSRTITANQTTMATTSAPATIHPVKTPLPKNIAATNEIPPIHARHAASRNISTLVGLKEVNKIH
jgi:hypothetical protein